MTHTLTSPLPLTLLALGTLLILTGLTARNRHQHREAPPRTSPQDLAHWQRARALNHDLDHQRHRAAQAMSQAMAQVLAQQATRAATSRTAVPPQARMAQRPDANGPGAPSGACQDRPSGTEAERSEGGSDA